MRTALGRGRDTEKVTKGILCPPAPLLGPPELATAQTLSLRASRGEESGVVRTVITTASSTVNTNTLKWRRPFSPAGPDFVCSLGQVSPCHSQWMSHTSPRRADSKTGTVIWANDLGFIFIREQRP